ncbi:hypothetical protein C2S51_006300 [Perilla frutescens var. frutescens]|nr:hypothetical protein C2S51_006300 [Perilla frutescens var. frutescens]
MLQRNSPVNDCTLNIAISCFYRLNRADFGFAILGSFFKLGYQPDVVTFTGLINGLFSVGKISEAAKLLAKQKLCKPDEVTYFTVISGFCKAGFTLNALDLLRLLQKGRCKPNIRTYNTMIDGLCKDRMVDDGLQLFFTLVDKGVSPNVVTYTSIIQGLHNFSRWKEGKAC